MRKLFPSTIVVTFAGIMVSTAAWAAELPETYVVGVGLNANTVASYKDEVPFWSKTIP